MSTDKPHLFRLDNQEVRSLDRKLVLGRHPGCTYVLSINDSSIGISGRHASVEADGDGAWVEDLNSTNGTWVRGERIAKRTRLMPGDRFQLDRLEFEFRAALKPAPPPEYESPTTVSIGIEDLALPAPAPMQPPPKSVPKAAPAPPPSPAPAPPEVVEAQPAQPAVAPLPPPAPAPAAENKSATRPQKVAGAWISADHSGKTKVLLPGERDRLKEQMGSGLYAGIEAVSAPTLVFAEPEGRRITLAQRDSATQEWSIGSNADAEVSIPQDGLSGLHAKILRNGQTWTISDLMSANGTFVNGQKINRSHLESGDQLGFGPVLCNFLLPQGAAAPVAPRTMPPGPTKKRGALPLPLLLGGGLVALALAGTVIYLLLR